MIIDNYALSTFLTCPAKFNLRLREKWASKRSSGALNAGLVLHKGLETWYKTGSLAKSLVAINEAWPAGWDSDDWRNLGKVLATMQGYTQRWPSEMWTVVGADQGEPQVEVSFTLPTGMYLDVCPTCSHDNGGQVSDTCVRCGLAMEPIEYGGIFDLPIEWNGTLYVMDHKTTTQFGKYYYSQYTPNNQITGYCWAASQLFGRRVGGAVINVIAWFKSSPTQFDRRVITRTQPDITHWLENVRQVANLMHRAERLGEYPMNTGSCTMYGACEYLRVHELSDPKERAGMLEMYYERKEWNHETRDAEVKGDA